MMGAPGQEDRREPAAWVGSRSVPRPSRGIRGFRARRAELNRRRGAALNSGAKVDSGVPGVTSSRGFQGWGKPQKESAQ